MFTLISWTTQAAFSNEISERFLLSKVLITIAWEMQGLEMVEIKRQIARLKLWLFQIIRIIWRILPKKNQSFSLAFNLRLSSIR